MQRKSHLFSQDHQVEHPVQLNVSVLLPLGTLVEITSFFKVSTIMEKEDKVDINYEKCVSRVVMIDDRYFSTYYSNNSISFIVPQ